MKIFSSWLILGPVLAFILSIPSWYVIDQLVPAKLIGLEAMIYSYPKGLLMSLLTPWGWSMGGGLLLMNSQKFKAGIALAIAGAVLLGGFWPIWATAIAT